MKMRPPTAATRASATACALRTLLLCLALLLPIRTALAQVTTCEWDGTPAETVTYTPWVLTDTGTLWDTYKRTCTSVFTGRCLCKTVTTVDKWVHIPDDGSKHIKSEETVYFFTTCSSAPVSTVQEYCSWVSPVPTGYSNTEHIVPYGETSMYNHWEDSLVTFDGVNVPFDTAINLALVGPGPHQYEVYRPGVTPDHLIFIVQVQPTWPVTVSSYPDVAVPTATLHLSSLASVSSAFLVRAQSLTPNLTAELSATTVGTGPHGGADFLIRFYTLPGTTVPLGTIPQAIVRLEMPDGSGRVMQTSSVTLNLPPRPASEMESVTIWRGLVSDGLAGQPYNGTALFDIESAGPFYSLTAGGQAHSVHPQSYASELRLRVTAPSGHAATFGPFSNQQTFTSLLLGPGSQPFCDSGPSSNWELRAFETFDDGGGGSIDAVWDWVTLRLHSGVADNFELYSTGSPCVPGGWEEFLGFADTCGVLTTEQAASGTHSVKVIGAIGGATGRGDNMIHQLGITGGHWLVRAKAFVPSLALGNAYTVLVDQYPAPLHYGAWVVLDASAGNVRNVINSSQQVPLIRNQWVPLELDVNLDADTVAATYNGQLIFSGESWRNAIFFPGSAPSGVGSIAGIVLHGGEPGIDGTTGIYFDDLDIFAVCQPACLADIVAIGGNPPPDGLLTGDDFNAFINAFAAADTLADIVSIGGLPPPDGLITGDDFNAFIAAFAAGCP